MTDNIKIAEFMGKEIITDSLPKYHESWDELIPTVKKCLENKKENIFADSLNTMDINIVYQAVLKYINQNKDE